MKNQFPNQFYSLFPFLLDTPSLSEDIAVVRLNAGICAFAAGSASTSIPLLVEGSIKVLKISESGREILLYRIKPGETCVIMLSSALGDIPYPATAIVEQDAQVLMIPNELYKKWLQQLPSVRNFTYQNLALRLSSVMALIEEIAFKRIDVRLISFLLDKTSENRPQIYLTHEDIAIELGTAREVISRVLKNLEGDHLLILSRGKIEIKDRKSLERMLLPL